MVLDESLTCAHSSGTMGLTAHLTAGEILEQLYHANQITKIRNVVFMGMGEPLDNYTAVLTSIRGMTYALPPPFLFFPSLFSFFFFGGGYVKPTA